MMKSLLLPLLASCAALSSCAYLTSPVSSGVTAHDHGKIGAGEGPAWSQTPWSGGALYFTDGKGINRFDAATGRTTVFRSNCGSPNGLMFTSTGALIMCESNGRRISELTGQPGSIMGVDGICRFQMDITHNASLEVLADRYDGHRFNSPNDLSLDSQGRIYFTDPRYGPRANMEMRDAAGNLVEGVYRIDPPKVAVYPGINRYNVSKAGYGPKVHVVPQTVSRILSQPEVERPNGILVSPGDRYLYICDNNNNTVGGSRKVLRFDLKKDGTVDKASRKVIFDWKNGRGPDGMKIDREGRLYVMAGVNKANKFETDEFKAGCYVLSPSGKLLAFIATAPDESTNCTFGGPGLKTLYMTSGNHLWSVPVNTAGRLPGGR